MSGARWILEISGGPVCKVYDCLTTTLHPWNEYKIMLDINYNWKIKIFLKGEKSLRWHSTWPCFTKPINHKMTPFHKEVISRARCHSCPWSNLECFQLLPLHQGKEPCYESEFCSETGEEVRQALQALPHTWPPWQEHRRGLLLLSLSRFSASRMTSVLISHQSLGQAFNPSGLIFYFSWLHSSS